MTKPITGPSILYRQIRSGQERSYSPSRQNPDNPLEVTVVFTDIPGTLAAIKRGADLAAGLRSRIRVVMPQVVRYPLPLSCPPVSREFMERRFRALGGYHPVSVRIEICRCRDEQDVFKLALAPQSVVLVGGRKRWWPTREKRLCRLLRHLGHHVIFAC